MSRPNDGAEVSVSPAKGLIALGGLTILILAFVFVCSHLKIKNFWVGFLFMFYWMGLEEGRFNRFLPTALGCLTGMLVSYSVNFFSIYMPLDQAALSAFCVSLLLIYFRMLGWFKWFANMATALFLTIGSIPLVHTSISMQEMFASLFLGIGFFGAVGGLGAILAMRKAARQQM